MIITMILFVTMKMTVAGGKKWKEEEEEESQIFISIKIEASLV